MSVILHDLTAGQDRRFSPYCWRTKLALAHKGVAYETRPLRFSDIDDLNPGGPRLTLPTLDDGDRRITDSWAIAEYLEAKHAAAPSLFPTGKAHPRFIQAWAFQALQPAALRVVLMDVFDRLDPVDQPYFRKNREERFGMSLEDFSADRPGALKNFRTTLQPIRDVLEASPFLAGETPAYADYIPAGAFLWAEAVEQTDLIEPGDPIADWLDRVRALV